METVFFFDALVSFGRLGIGSMVLDDVVLYHAVGKYNVVHDCGVSIFLPMMSNKIYHDTYKYLLWNKETGWFDKFVQYG